MYVPIMFCFITKIQYCINMVKMTLSFGLHPEVRSVAMLFLVKLITAISILLKMSCLDK